MNNNKIKIAINGFGRIGRCVLRAKYEDPAKFKNIKIMAINAGVGDVNEQLQLLRYDSVHGPFKMAKLATDGKNIDIGEDRIPIIFEKDPKVINWREFEAETVLECSGVFTSKSAAMQHVEAGARRVIISAPAKDEVDATIVYGVNHQELKAEHQVISLGSCTTNCLAPVAKILDAEFGIENGFMTTIHAYTNDQNLADSSHTDVRRARAAALSMIPTSTGAAKAIGLVLPKLQGKLDGTAIRVPTPNVSLIDLVCNLRQDVDVKSINQALQRAAALEMRGVLEYSEEKLVSIDYNHNPHSSIFDPFETKVVGDNGKLIRVCAWYDNEWGFSNRMLDTLVYWSQLV